MVSGTFGLRWWRWGGEFGNGGLGQFRDDEDALSNAVAYLARTDDLQDAVVERAHGLVRAPG